ncbi:DUF803-domain-containing protein [Auriculariales sp. MPI-PUGE-AT-0066]|nr:DUF803-domain-containing protein [Auriculariales sp. MPI-PUGE-AT-0066]
MVDDKYIGLGLAVSGTVAIGSSFIVTKKASPEGLIDAAKRAGADSASGKMYLKNPLWWAGTSLLVLGEFANFAAYAFAPPILVTPLGALSVLVGAVLASIFLKEELGHIGRIGCTLCLLGSLVIVLHAPEDREIETVDEILHYALQPGFLLYALTCTIFSLWMIYKVSPVHGKSNPLVYISICSLAGSVSVMFIKGLGIALKLTMAGHNQLTHPSTYVFGIIVVTCIFVQMHYFNKALDTFSANLINPLYYVGFSSATIIASLILFQGFDTADATNTVSLITGFFTTFLGVHLLNHSHAEATPEDRRADGYDQVPLSGVFQPRLSLSIESPRVSTSSQFGHGRRSSAYRIFDADADDVQLRPLREEDEEDFEDVAAEVRHPNGHAMRRSDDDLEAALVPRIR